MCVKSGTDLGAGLTVMMPPGKAAQQRRVPGCVCRRTRTAAGTVVSPRELMVDSNMLAAVDQSPIEPCTEARAYCGEMPSRHAPPEAHLPTNFALHYSTSRKIPDGHYFSPTNYILSGHSHLIETNKVRRNQANQINNLANAAKSVGVGAERVTGNGEAKQSPSEAHHGQHPAMRCSRAMPDRPRAQGNGFNSAGTTGVRRVDIRASPEPPSKTPTGRESRFAGTASMGFSFGWKRNAHPWRGTWGSPFGMLHRERQSGSVARRVARTGRRPRVLADRAFARCRCQPAREVMASTACRLPLDPRVARLGTQISLTAERNTRPWAWPDPTEAGDPQGR
jgi:hypothetical protein